MATALQPAAAGGARPGGRKKTVEETYKKLSQLEHILLRPDTYIGSAACAPAGAPVHVWDAAAGGIRARDVVFAPGLYKIFDEILVNAADHVQRGAGMKSLRVEIEEENGRVSVWNDGAGIPIMMHATEGVWVPELIFGHLLTSSNYDDGEKKVVGGRNGYGAKLANIFSTQFVVETADAERRKKYRQVFRDNMSVVGKPAVADAGGRPEDWTRITFYPDLGRFGMACLDADIVALMTKRVYDVAATNPALRVTLNGARLPLRGFKDYIKLYHGEAPDVPFVHERCGERWEIAVGVSGGAAEQVSFVNSICTVKGGTHVDHVVNQIVGRVQEHVAKKNKGMKLKPHQVKSHLSVFVNALIENPAFDSQTKEALTSKASTFGSRCVISDDAFRKILRGGVVESVLSYARFKESRELTKTDGGKKARVLGVPKLDDANKAGGREASKCTLILTEGDSAKALAVSGLSVIGRDYYGVFPLRGKLLNVREASHKQIMDNAEITNLKKILGLQHGKTYSAESVKALRYGHVLIMTDQDHDGSHIKGLLINFFDHFWPALLRVDGFLQEFITPIVKCVKGASVREFFTMPEYEQWFETSGPGWRPKYYKGLGTSTPAEAKAYFSDLVKHLLSFSWGGDEDGKMIELAFAKARVNDRKRWLTDHVPGSYFDHARDDLTFSNFINKELILFSIADNARSIPSVVDGLKPSQRKVLFACFKRKLVKNEIKVAQLAGYVSEHAAYHHGEASLQATILGLAQNFVGSNNANLLVPAGQFGTRLQGGKDAASSRYIFTKLAPIARALFPEPDDHVLRYLEDDGLSIEPEWYCPVIPTVLLNGADGIGTGWSSQVPCYNPRDLIANIRRMIAGDEPQELIPWYRGFLGTVTPVGNSKSYDVHGTVTGGGADDVFVVRELPVRTWTTPYKDFLEAHVVGNPEGGKQTPFIKECADQGTENKVCFTVTLTADAAAGAADGGIYKKLKLSSSVTTSNMMLFDAEGRIAKYGDTSSIFNEFFGVRMATYERRRAFLLGALEDELECLDNKQRFILMVVDGKLLVSKRKKAVIVADLVKHGFKRIPKAAKRAGGVKAGGGRLAGHAQRIGDENGGSSSSEAEGGTRGDGALAGGATDFDYLLSLPIYSLTMERVERLCAQRDEKAAERDEMEATTAADMWRRDLDHLETVLAEGEAQAAKDAVELEKAARAAQRKQGGARGGGRGHSKKVLHAGLEDEGDEGGGAGPIPPPSARTEKVRQARAPKETAAKAVKPASTKASAGAAGATAARKASKARRGGEGIELEEYDSDTSSSQDEEAGYVSDGDSDAEDGELVDSAPGRSDDGGVVRMPPARPGARGAVAAAKLCAAPASKAKSVAACPARPRSKKPVVYVSDDSSGAEGDNGAPAAGDSAGAPESGDDDADVFMPPAKPTTKGADASKPRVPPAAKAKPVAARPAGSRLRKKPAPPVVVASESERDGSGSSSEDDAQNMTLAERLAQRGRAAVQGAPSSREGTGGAGSGKPQVLTSSLIPAFTSPAAASKRQRAGARPAEAIAAAVPDEMFSPSPRQVKKKSRVVSPAAAKPKAKSLVAKPAAAAKPKPRARVKARVPAKTSKKQLVIDTPSERGAGEEDSADAETPKAPAARPRRGTVKKSIVIDSSSGDEVGTADDDDEFDADDDDDSDFE